MPRPSPMCAAAIAAAFVLLSAGCQQTKLGATWQSEEFGQGNYQRVMILGLTDNAKNRRTFEYELAVQLQRIDVETIPSLELLSPKDKPVRDVIQPILLENGIDGILVVRPTGSESGGPRTVTRDDIGFYGYYGQYHTVQGADYTTVFLETSLYDAKTAELVWRANSETFDPVGVKVVARSLAASIIKYLKQQGLVG